MIVANLNKESPKMKLLARTSLTATKFEAINMQCSREISISPRSSGCKNHQNFGEKSSSKIKKNLQNRGCNKQLQVVEKIPHSSKAFAGFPRSSHEIWRGHFGKQLGGDGWSKKKISKLLQPDDQSPNLSELMSTLQLETTAAATGEETLAC